MFKTKHNRLEQVANFTTVDNIFKPQVRNECDLFVLEYLEREVKSVPEEFVPVLKEDGTMTKIEELQSKSKYGKHLNQVHKVKIQLKQTYSRYYG